MGRQSPRDQNFIPAALFEIDGSPGQVMPGQIDQATGRVLVETGTTTNFQKDAFTSTNNQTTFVPTKTVIFDLYMSVNGSIQMPSANYSLIGGSYVLNSGVPAGCDVILCYTY